MVQVLTAHKAGFIADKVKAREGMESRLIGHGQNVDTCLCRKSCPVFWDTGIVRGTDMGKEAGHIEKEVKEGAIVLVPEEGRNVPIPCKLYKIPYGAVALQIEVPWMIPHEIAPLPMYSVKDRFHENEIGFPGGEDVLVIARRKAADATLLGKTQGCEGICHSGNFQDSKWT